MSEPRNTPTAPPAIDGLIARREAEVRSGVLGREAHGWTPAAVGCHWSRGEYFVSTTQIADGSRSGYVLMHQREQLGEFISWAEVERLAERRIGERRRA